VKIPRDVAGRDLARRLRRFGYEIRRQTGSHMRLTSSFRGVEHHLTIPDHDDLRVGTLRSVLGSVAVYLDRPVESLIEELFG
jgi:predicted RNA binding protein YcfA (HicA-like mRNA interferase family)